MLRFATGIAPWLPGVSAGSRLGLDDGSQRADRSIAATAKPAGESARSDERLPARDDTFYWSLMHSHL